MWENFERLGLIQHLSAQDRTEHMGKGVLFPGHQKIHNEGKSYKQWFQNAFMYHAIFIKFLNTLLRRKSNPINELNIGWLSAVFQTYRIILGKNYHCNERGKVIRVLRSYTGENRCGRIFYRGMFVWVLLFCFKANSEKLRINLDS